MYTKTWKIEKFVKVELSPLRLKIQLYQLLVRNGFFENGTKRSSTKQS
jgi:hypothetical protein